jgi:hypothetical protein
MADVAGYVSGFVGALIAFAVGLGIGGYAVGLATNTTGMPLISGGLVGTVIGAGLLLFLVKTFI